MKRPHEVNGLTFGSVVAGTMLATILVSGLCCDRSEPDKANPIVLKESRQLMKKKIKSALDGPNEISVNLEACSEDMLSSIPVCYKRFLDIDGDGKTVEQYLETDSLYILSKNIVRQGCEAKYDKKDHFGIKKEMSPWQMREIDNIYQNLVGILRNEEITNSGNEGSFVPSYELIYCRQGPNEIKWEIKINRAFIEGTSFTGQVVYLDEGKDCILDRVETFYETYPKLRGFIPEEHQQYFRFICLGEVNN